MQKQPAKQRIETFVRGPRHRPGWRRVSGHFGHRLDVVDLGLSSFEWTDLYHSLISMPWLTFFLAIAAWYLAINLVFATVYFFIGSGQIAGVHATSGLPFFVECCFFSVQTLATIGYGRVNPVGLASNLAVAFEALFGLLSVAVITGLLFARFSRPTSRIQFSQVALVTSMDGLPHLNFRVSNERANHVVEASISVSVLKDETTAEGQHFRNWYDLRLERSRTPLLALSWTIVHPIDEQSPLYGLSPDDVVRGDVQIYATVSGVDENLGQTIYSRYLYRPDDIVWDARFSDMLKTEEDRIVINRSMLHEFERV